MTDRRQYAPATQRNREAIAAILQEYLPNQGSILEIASGTGEHACFFAPIFSPRWWITSDADALSRESITAWHDHEGLPSFRPPLNLDVTAEVWEVEQEILEEPITSIVAINMIHISPWQSCLGLLAGAQRILPPGGILYLYGPYRQVGVPTAPSNEAFDRSLQNRNPAWGLRNLEDVTAEAQKRNLTQKAVVKMPANNLSVIFEKNV